MNKYAFRIPSILLLVGSMCAAAGHASAAIINATSCSVANVSSAITAAANGDTVQIPNGSCTWTSGISTSKQITLQGATVGGVTITHGAGAATLLTMTIGSSNRTQLANLRFMPGTATGVYVQIDGTGLTPLMHDVYFNIPNFQLLSAVHWFVKGGVIWRATFESTDFGSPVYGSESGCLQIKGAGLPWQAASTMGILDTDGTANTYIEDSVFSNVGQCPDVDDFGRVVIRHSQSIGSSGLTHGTTSFYGGRQVELYDNTFTYPNQNRNLGRYFWFRAGTAVITRNSIQAIAGQMYGTRMSFQFAVENAQRAGAIGCCTSYMCFHQPGSGGNGTSQISDPVYIWGNTGTGGTSSMVFSTNEGAPADCGTAHNTPEFFKLNRDYFIETGPKPGYTSYVYPHPLALASGNQPGGASNLRLQ